MTSATWKQIDYLKDLIANRDPEDLNVRFAAKWMKDPDFSIKDASKCIDSLLKLPKVKKSPAPAPAPATAPAAPAHNPTMPKVGVYDSMPDLPLSEFVNGRYYILYVNTHGKVTAKCMYKSWTTISGFTWKKAYGPLVISKINNGQYSYLGKEAVQAVGEHFNFCLCCGAKLTDPQSQKQKIGPVCAKKFQYV